MRSQRKTHPNPVVRSVLRYHLLAFVFQVTQYSGYYKIDEEKKTNEHYFYWMFESRNDPKTDPLVLWLTGGPGCSGMLALLNENGPCSIKKDESGVLSEVNYPQPVDHQAQAQKLTLHTH